MFAELSQSFGQGLRKACSAKVKKKHSSVVGFKLINLSKQGETNSIFVYLPEVLIGERVYSSNRLARGISCLNLQTQ